MSPSTPTNCRGWAGLGWDWQVDHCPTEATMAEDEVDDSPARITSVGVLTDSDDLKIQLKAWFGELAFG